MNRFFSKCNRCFSTAPSVNSNHNFSSTGKLLGVAIAASICSGGVLYFKGNEKMNCIVNNISMPMLRMLNAEMAHKAAIKATKLGLSPKDLKDDDACLKSSAFGFEFSNPIGMAAGFDKHGEATQGIIDMGFGFMEIGSVTPLPQEGNARPRVFRLLEDEGVINRYGFNSVGMTAASQNLKHSKSSKQRRKGWIGVNLGKNKTSTDAAADYVAGMKTLGEHADYFVINISSPNTPGLRKLQGRKQLQALLEAVLHARGEISKSLKRDKIPLLLKIAPDLTNDDKRDIADLALSMKLDGLIVGNTTISRPSSLVSDHRSESGGLSGKPLKELSTSVIRDMYKLTNGKMPIVGVGGVASGQDAYDKIKAGATLVQLYSSLVYHGPTVVRSIKSELVDCLERDGFDNVSDAVGADHKRI